MAHAQLTQAQYKLATRVEIQYRDRIKVIKEKGDTLIKEIPAYVTQADAAHFGVNVGFVRHYNAAFTRESAGPAAQSDREPASISLTEIAKIHAHNASACLQWREQALGFREFYKQLQQAQ
ncbi:hypothetical protein BGZ97_004385 [Linnemannia gamsii]|uniref:Uncharacterized protein n=1 Tax=Linnemannia gamsii TaxID=64522 RepID=A0A9P6QRV0_9FUNG|nr:hypothetical protein BGZ97_004385 [Linnemannia gamsii]